MANNKKTNKLEEIFWKRDEGRFVNIEGKEVVPKAIGTPQIYYLMSYDMCNLNELREIKELLSSWRGSTDEVNAYIKGNKAGFEAKYLKGDEEEVVMFTAVQFYKI